MDQSTSDIITSEQVPISSEPQLNQSGKQTNQQEQYVDQQQADHQDQQQQQEQHNQNQEEQQKQYPNQNNHQGEGEENNFEQGEQYQQQNQNQNQNKEQINHGETEGQYYQEQRNEGEGEQFQDQQERRSQDHNEIDQHAIQNHQNQNDNQDYNQNQQQNNEQPVQTQEVEQRQPEQNYQEQNQQNEQQYYNQQHNNLQQNENNQSNQPNQNHQNQENDENAGHQYEQNQQQHPENNQQDQNQDNLQQSQNQQYHNSQQQQQIDRSNNQQSQSAQYQRQQLINSNQINQSSSRNNQNEDQQKNSQYNSNIQPPSSQYFQQQQQDIRTNNRFQELDERRNRQDQRQPYALYHREQQSSHYRQSSPVDQSVQDLNRSHQVVQQHTQNNSIVEEQRNIQQRSDINISNPSIVPSIIPSASNQSQQTSNISSAPPPIVPIAAVVPVPIQDQQQIKEQIPVEVQIPPHDDFQVMILPPQGLQPATIGNMYSSAFEQRREINRKLMMELFDKRNAYYLNHIGILDHIRLGLRLRIKNSRQAIESFKTFFKEQIAVYNQVINSMKNIVQLRGKAQTETLKVHWSSALKEGVYKNIEDQSEIIEMMTSYKSLTNQNFVQQMELAWRQYEKVLEVCQNKSLQSRKEFSKFEQKVIDMEKDIHKKFKKQQKNPDKKNKGYDLAEQQIVIFRQMKIGKDKLTKWGETVIQWWEEQISEEIKLLVKIKELVNNFVDLTNKIHVISQHIRNRSSSWNLENIQQDVLNNYEFQNIVCLTDIDFVRGSLQTYNRLPRPDKMSINDITTFNKIEYDERIMGKKDIRIDCLIVKQFKCKQMIPGQEQLGIIRVVATIDDNLLIIDQEDKVINSKLKELMNTRPEGNVVKVNYKKKGWFIDDWESVFLEFKSEDKAEEFMFFTETNSETRNEYVV